MEKLLVISSYPRQGITHDTLVVGVATYTKNTLKALSSQVTTPVEITVLAEKLPGSSDIYIDENIHIERVWQRKSLISFFSLFKAVNRHKSTENILVELELAMFGGILHLVPLPFFLLYLKLCGKKTTVVFHQVITSVSEVHGQLNVSEKGVKATLLTHLLRLFYRFVLFNCFRAIVFDEFLKVQLGKFGSSEKIVVIAHGVESFTKLPSQTEAKKTLNLPLNRPILLYFGFLAWYKGTDLLIDAYASLPKKDRPVLVIAGGPNPNHTDKAFYQDYIKRLKEKALAQGVIITDFVPEELITTYFAASDLCILPYRTFMSSSGPLSFVFSTGKPFLVSNKLRPVFASLDIARIIKAEGISEEDLVFTSQEDLKTKLTAMLNNPSLQNKIKNLSTTIAQNRSWDRIGRNYAETLFN